uniref:Eukaryotic translation initiation factor 3 subunit M n=2 Tax=Ditylum brightwellii TaxID=49249 RepID=A0A6S8Z843_9STRA
MVPPIHPSSTLVNVAEHAELRLVRLLSGGAAPSFESTCEACIANADAPGLIRSILSDSGAMDALFALDPVEEAVSAFSLLAALLDRVGSDRPDEEAGLAKELADTVGNNESYDVTKRIAMLCALYNLRSDGAEKTLLLARIVQLSASSDPKSLCPGQPLGDLLEADNIMSMMASWAVPKKEQRFLFRKVVDGVGAGGEKSLLLKRQRYLLLLVESYTDESEIDEEALTAAKDASVGAIQDPVALFTEQRGMLVMPAIVGLGNNPATKQLHALLQIFQEGKLQDYDAFVTNNSPTLTEYGLSNDDCVRYMRLLSLCSLAAEHEEIPYGAIASTLHVKDEEVESWVIAAVSSGLLSAKMDQLQQVVMVERCAVRKFGMEQWKMLQTRLNDWKRNVKGVLDGLKQSQQAGVMQ